MTRAALAIAVVSLLGACGGPVGDDLALDGLTGDEVTVTARITGTNGFIPTMEWLATVTAPGAVLVSVKRVSQARFWTSSGRSAAYVDSASLLISTSSVNSPPSR